MLQNFALSNLSALIVTRTVAPVVTAAVPLPASGLLLVAAVGGAGAVRRQRKVA